MLHHGLSRDFTLTVPEGVPASEVEQRTTGEATRVAELAAQGHALRVWKPLPDDGRRRAIGLYRATDDVRAASDPGVPAAAAVDGDLGDGARRAPQRPRAVERTGVVSDQTPRVAVITGASQGIGASLVGAYRELGYAVVGTSRTIVPSDDPMIAAVQGDIAQPDTADAGHPDTRSSASVESTR